MYDTHRLDFDGIDAAAFVDIEELVQVLFDLLDLIRADAAIMVEICKQTLFSRYQQARTTTFIKHNVQ